MNPHEKQYQFLRGLLFLYAGLCLTGCAFTGKALTTSGTAGEPHLVWNGSHFGIVYYHTPTPGSWPVINMVKVDKNANIISSKTNVGSIPHLYQPFYLSDLVWNNDNKQFAFAYTKGKVIHFIRMDANLNMLAPILEIKFNVPVTSNEHPTLVDLSLVWNHERKEYGLTYITKEHPYLQDRHDDVYISRISANGTYVGPYERFHLVTCPGDCEKTSLTYNTSNGQYAFSYLENNYPTQKVMIGLYSPGGTVSEHTLMSGWNAGVGKATRIVHDPNSHEYMVVALKAKPGSFNGHEVGYQIAGSNGAPQGSYYVMTGTAGYNEITSAVPFLTTVDNNYLIAASEQPQIHVWMALESGFIANDWAYTKSNVKSWHPSLAMAGSIYMAWIQDGTLYFGVAKKE